MSGFQVMPARTDDAALDQVPEQPAAAIRWHEQAADLLSERSDSHRFEAARLMYDEIVVDGIETGQSLAEKIGRSDVHVSRCVRIHKIIVSNLGSESRSWNELYQHVKAKPAPELESIDDGQGTADHQVNDESIELETVDDPEVEDVVEQARDWLDQAQGHVVLTALSLHRPGEGYTPMGWQSIGDYLERTLMPPVREVFDDDEISTALIDSLEMFFDQVRAIDCAPGCTTCTPEDRRWRDEHPERVYRHSDPSNLDSSVVGGGAS